jgi:hypothetical protein
MPMANRSQDCIQDRVEILRHIFGEEAEDEEAVFLKQAVLAPIAPVGDRIGQMLRTVEFHGDPKIAAEHVDFHLAPAVEGNGQSVSRRR